MGSSQAGSGSAWIEHPTSDPLEPDWGLSRGPASVPLSQSPSRASAEPRWQLQRSFRAHQARSFQMWTVQGASITRGMASLV